MLPSTALTIATTAHAGQVDKAGVDYIHHPLAVAQAVEPFGQEAVAVALLHDVIEDTEWTRHDLMEEGVSELVASLVQALSRGSDLANQNALAAMDNPRAKITYMDYVRGIASYCARIQNNTPALVKYADNRHNALRQDTSTSSLQSRNRAAEEVLRSAIGDESADLIERAIKGLLAA